MVSWLRVNLYRCALVGLWRVSIEVLDVVCSPCSSLVLAEVVVVWMVEVMITWVKIEDGQALIMVVSRVFELLAS